MNPTLDWISRAERPSGGLAAWQTPSGIYHDVYIECTGYAIPTLLKFSSVNRGADALALRCANWLLSVQNPDGSFNGLDGVPRPFDTSAVIEGLQAIGKHTRKAIYRNAAKRAVTWCSTQITEDGYLKNSPANYEANVYQLRAAYIVGNRREVDYWKARGLIQARERSHYLAYALEGLLNFGETDYALPYLEVAYKSGNLLQAFYVDSNWQPTFPDWDICASAQMAILFRRVGWDVSRHYEAIRKYVKEDGGVPQSSDDARAILWAGKFWLDLVYEMEGAQ